MYVSVALSPVEKWLGDHPFFDPFYKKWLTVSLLNKFRVAIGCLQEASTVKNASVNTNILKSQSLSEEHLKKKPNVLRQQQLTKPEKKRAKQKAKLLRILFIFLSCWIIRKVAIRLIVRKIYI